MDNVVHLGSRGNARSRLLDIISSLKQRAEAGQIDGLFVVDIGKIDGKQNVSLSQTDLSTLSDPVALLALVGSLEVLKRALMSNIAEDD